MIWGYHYFRKPPYVVLFFLFVRLQTPLAEIQRDVTRLDANHYSNMWSTSQAARPKPHGPNSWNSETKKFCCVGIIWCVLPDLSSEKPQLLLCLAVMNMLLLGSLMTRAPYICSSKDLEVAEELGSQTRPLLATTPFPASEDFLEHFLAKPIGKGQIEVEYISS